MLKNVEMLRNAEVAGLFPALSAVLKKGVFGDFGGNKKGYVRDLRGNKKSISSIF